MNPHPGMIAALLPPSAFDFAGVKPGVRID